MSWCTDPVDSVSISPARQDTILHRQTSSPKLETLPLAESEQKEQPEPEQQQLVSPQNLRQQIEHHNERELALKANLREEQSKNESLQQQMRKCPSECSGASLTVWYLQGERMRRYRICRSGSPSRRRKWSGCAKCWQRSSQRELDRRSRGGAFVQMKQQRYDISPAQR